MGQKTNPLILRARKNFKNIHFTQQTIHKKFLPYSFKVAETISYFIKSFFQNTCINLHSFNLFKNYKGNNVILVRYLVFEEFSREKIQNFKNSKFKKLEDAFLVGLTRLGNKKPFLVCFINLAKQKVFLKQSVNALIVTKIFSALEIRQFLNTCCVARGISFFLCEFFSKKLTNLRSKSNKKLLGRFISFLEKLMLFLKQGGLIGLKGLKIQLKGRLQGLPRSKKVSFQFGSLSLQKFDSNVDFYQTHVLTHFGSLGLSVWASYF